MSRPLRRRGQKGQAVVELSLVVGLLLTLGVGTFDLGRAYALSQTAGEMARAGARIGIEQDLQAGPPSCPDGSGNYAINCEAIGAAGGQSNTPIGFIIQDQPSAGINLDWGSLTILRSTTYPWASDSCTDPATAPWPAGRATSGNCGDAQTGGSVGGCSSTSAFWTENPDANACFATRTCYYYQGAIPNSPGTDCDGWGTRPTCPVPSPGTPIPDQQCWQTSYTTNAIGDGLTYSCVEGGGSCAYPMLDVRVVLRFTAVTPFVSTLIGNAGVIYLSRDSYGLPLY